MAKKKSGDWVRLISSSGTGFFYVAKSPKNRATKWEVRKFDPKARKHVIFKEAKMR